jgi:hypothetical protein
MARTQGQPRLHRQGPLDPSERRAVEYWMKRWGVTRDQITAAHRKVGRLTRRWNQVACGLLRASHEAATACPKRHLRPSRAHNGDLHMRFLTSAGLGVTIAFIGAPSMAQETKLKEVASEGAAKHQSATYRSDAVEVPLQAAGAAGSGHKVEYMVRMKAGDVLVYSWEAPAGADVWHEFHGHTADAVTFYKKAAGAAHHGSLTAPFDGIHGWYYENRTNAPVGVRLKLSGYYELLPTGK